MDAPFFRLCITQTVILQWATHGIHTSRVVTESYRWVRHVTCTVVTSHANRTFLSFRADRLRGWKLDVTSSGSYRLEGGLALTEPNLWVLLPELVGYLSVTSLDSGITHLATGIIFRASDRLRQNPAPPVANQNEIFC